MLGDIERQLNFEESTDTEAAVAKLNALLQEAAAGSADTTRASALISRMYEAVVQRIDEHKAATTRGVGGKYRNWLRALPSDVAAVIAIRECIQVCMTQRGAVRIQTLTRSIGALYELEARILAAEKVNPVYMRKIHEQIKENATTSRSHIRRTYNTAIERIFKGEIDYSLTSMEVVQLGRFGVDACYEAGLLTMMRSTGSAGSNLVYELDPQIEKFLLSYTTDDVRFIIHKEESRMYCPPDDWTTLYDGGYLTPRRKAVSPLMSLRNIRKEERPRLAAEFTAANMPMVFSVANYLQGTAFSIHEPTRAAIQRVWESGGGVLGVPTKTPPKSPAMPFPPEWDKELASPAELEQFAQWKRDRVRHFKDIRTWRGKSREIGAFLRVSRESGVPIWFPVYMDTRSRWYYRGVPNPQGSDLAKAVLHFHHKKPLGKEGLFWLKVHIANSFGYDKERFVDRARWTEQHWEAIARALDAPEDYPEVWGTDAPWCMYSAAWELRAALLTGHPEQYCTGIPCHMDATCSGLQHFSAMLRDPVGASYVNLDDEAKCGPKQDIYSRVATNALASIKRDLEDSDPVTQRYAKWWLEIGFPRALAKKPVNS